MQKDFHWTFPSMTKVLYLHKPSLGFISHSLVFFYWSIVPSFSSPGWNSKITSIKLLWTNIFLIMISKWYQKETSAKNYIESKGIRLQRHTAPSFFVIKYTFHLVRLIYKLKKGRAEGGESQGNLMTLWLMQWARGLILLLSPCVPEAVNYSHHVFQHFFF